MTYRGHPDTGDPLYWRQSGIRIAWKLLVAALPLSLLLAAAPMPLLSREPLPPLSRPQDSEYAGAELCALCHEDIGIDLLRNPHRDEQAVAGDTAHGACETCHGPGLAHTESMDRGDIRVFGSLGPVTESDVCMDCHAENASHSDRLFDAHRRKSVSCTSCHDIHASPEPRDLLRGERNDVCAECHRVERAAFERPFSHRLREGALACVDCHQPHGSQRPTQLRSSHSNEEGCFDCHGDKRGPFAFQHMPASVDGCAACHEPHGSSNPRMLTRHEVRFVCLECHTGGSASFGRQPPAFHDLRSSRIRNCTLCHAKIHGSNLHRAFLR